MDDGWRCTSYYFQYYVRISHFSTTHSEYRELGEVRGRLGSGLGVGLAFSVIVAAAAAAWANKIGVS